ncbi:MAG: TonB C-terminal domain-containing protein [Steroidobacter sp.]
MSRSRWHEWIPVVIGTVVVIVIIVLLLLAIWYFRHNKPKSDSRQVAQVVKIIRPPQQDTPPPPPPPPPEKIEQPVEQEPQPTPDQAPQEALGIDADASAGGDSFGLAARPGGCDLVGTGTAPFKWYTNLMANRLQECFSGDERLRKGNYRANLRVRIADDGRLEILELLGTSGNAEKDAAIRNMKNCNTGESRPLEMPRLATIQIVSRG